MKNYIIFDLEWNQSPEGKENSIERMPFEIIEIGAVKLDGEFRIMSEFHHLITPKVYTQLHYKISEVTHMDIRELEQEGEPFTDVIRKFLEWCGRDYRFCTWGSMDLTELQRNMEYYHIEIPFERPLYYYDVQKLYALVRGNMREKTSLDKAVEELGLHTARPFHRALDDAFYTGKVLQNMDLQVWEPYISVDYYWVPEKKEEEFTLNFPTYIKYVSRTFHAKEEALEDKTVTHIICPQCRRMLRKKIRWFSINQKQYFSLGICPEHGYVRGKIRMKKAENGEFYAVKTLKAADGEGVENIFRKREEQRKKRHIRSEFKKIKRGE
ncbi:MAG: exonuclease domain-containing protein [Hungatella sp.]|jgi:inhibitor of KinA sporulation pathway (predicted exonuclease)|nr:exonuclease domain-containing protein [Hungatella sp.]